MMAAAEGRGVPSAKVLSEVAKAVGKEWKRLGRQLSIEDCDLDNIEQKNLRDYREASYQVLRLWTQRKGQKATLRELVRHVEEIDRKDIADQICDKWSTTDVDSGGKIPWSLEPTPVLERKRLLRGSFQVRIKTHRILKQIQQTLTEEYKCVQLRGLPWIEEIVLTLDEFYVEMSMVALDKRGRELPKQPIQIEHLFCAQKGEPSPSRILIEGGPGFGKSTLAAKLAYDWAQKKSYVKHFDLVFLLPLRHFAGDLMQVLVASTGVKEKNKEYVHNILNNKSKCVLIILDGYDEISPEAERKLRPILNREILCHTTLIITARVGEFTSNKQDGESRWSIWSDADIGTKFGHFLDKRVCLEGMNSKRQHEFFAKHVAGYPEEVISNLKSKLRLLVDKDVLKCPLFFLMFLAIFQTENEVENIQTKSDLYKNIFNYVLRRYFSRKSKLTALDIDLFAYDQRMTTKANFVQLMVQFGNFAVEALQKDKLSFTREDIIGPSKRDPAIIDLGLLIKCLSVKGIAEVVTYEPVHRSLLEFAAAYTLWIEYVDGYPREQWLKRVCSLRPMDSSSLVFPFLTGLMAENARILFEALKPYAAEYWDKFYCIELSLLEVKSVSSVLDSLTPFLPTHWKIKGYHDSLGFSKSQQHEEVLKQGIKLGKIKLIKWPYQCVLPPHAFPDDAMIRYPYDTQVEQIRLIISDSAVEPSKFSQNYYGENKFKCRELLCIFHNVSGHYSANEIWSAFLNYLDCFDFQQLSFHFTASVSDFLYNICSAIEHTKLKNVNIHAISCDVKEKANIVVKWLKYLITKDKLTAVELRIYPQPLVRAPQRGSLLSEGITQEHVNILVSSASGSASLTRLSLKNTQEGNRITVDLFLLCDGGKKSWESLELSNANISCKERIANNFHIRNLVLTSIQFLEQPSNFFLSCDITSLSCSSSMLETVSRDRAIVPSLSELNIEMDLFCVPNHYDNLQILSLNLTSLNSDTCPTPIQNLLLGTRHHLWLTGLEIWGVETKFKLAVDFVEGVVQCLQGTSVMSPLTARDQTEEAAETATSSNAKKLQLLYFTLATGANDNVREDNAGNDVKYDNFLFLAAQLKSALADEYLPRMNIICHRIFFTNVLKFNSKGITSWLQVFPPDEGFHLKYDLHGLREHDSTWSRFESDVALSSRLNRISISFSKD